MRFKKILPDIWLQPFIKYFVVLENESENVYKVFPSSGLVIGFQYKGQLLKIKDNYEHKLNAAGITGISDCYKTFKNSADTGTILVYFTEIGFTHFTAHPANELFNLSVPLEEIFGKDRINEIQEKLSVATTDLQRIEVIERLLFSQLNSWQTDKLILEAIKLIYQSQGNIRIKELNQKLCISQSPLEKRFRKVVGSTPKKFASIVRFNALLETLSKKSLTEICYEYKFFDQAHFIKDFKQFTGVTPTDFKRTL